MCIATPFARGSSKKGAQWARSRIAPAPKYVSSAQATRCPRAATHTGPGAPLRPNLALCSAIWHGVDNVRGDLAQAQSRQATPCHSADRRPQAPAYHAFAATACVHAPARVRPGPLKADLLWSVRLCLGMWPFGGPPLPGAGARLALWRRNAHAPATQRTAPSSVVFVSLRCMSVLRRRPPDLDHLLDCNIALGRRLNPTFARSKRRRFDPRRPGETAGMILSVCWLGLGVTTPATRITVQQPPQDVRNLTSRETQRSADRRRPTEHQAKSTSLILSWILHVLLPPAAKRPWLNASRAAAGAFCSTTCR